MRNKLIRLIACWSLFAYSFCRPPCSARLLGNDDLETRLAYFLLQRQDFDEKMSVMVEKRIATEEPGEDGGKKVGISRSIQRLVFASSLKASRMDGMSLDVLNDELPERSFSEAMLLLDSRGMHFDAGTGLVSNFQLKGNSMPFTSHTRWKHPFAMATSQGAGNLIDGDRGSIFAIKPKDIIEQKELADGRSYIKFYSSNSTAHGITFAGDESWRIEQVDFFHKDGGAASRTLAEPNTLKHYATTRTSWKKVPTKEGWVPVKVDVESDDGVVQEKWQIRFADWKFGNDVDLNLLREESFTVEKIRKSVDFVKLSQDFNDLK